MENTIYNVDIHIVDKCNLNCKHCNHFCPLVPNDTQPKSLTYITQNLYTLSRYKSIINNITILGGEPFLHPNLSYIIVITRKLFPNTNIGIITNGTLYGKLSELAQVIIDNKINVTLSLYPIPNTDKIKEEFIRYIPDTLLSIDNMSAEIGFSYRLLMEDINTNDHHILACPRRHWCTQIRDGRLYICHFAAQLYQLKNAFPEQIHINEDDCYIQLGPTTSPEMVIDFLNKNIPDVCRHCDDVNQYVEGDQYYYDVEPWCVSDKKLDEFYRSNM